MRTEDQPAALPPTTPYTASISAQVTRTAPGTSSFVDPRTTSSAGSTARVASRTARPTGTLTRKIQCHDSVPVRTPPSSTPTAPPPDITKPKTPIALARSRFSVNSPMISASATAETAAPARPCTARPTTRNDGFGASPQTAEASVKETTPPRKTRRLPSRSPSRPESSRKPPKVSR